MEQNNVPLGSVLSAFVLSKQSGGAGPPAALLVYTSNPSSPASPEAVGGVIVPNQTNMISGLLSLSCCFIMENSTVPTSHALLSVHSIIQFTSLRSLPIEVSAPPLFRRWAISLADTQAAMASRRNTAKDKRAMVGDGANASKSHSW